MKIEQFTKAPDYFKQSLMLKNQLPSKRDENNNISITLHKIGRFHAKINKSASAIDYTGQQKMIFFIFLKIFYRFKINRIPARVSQTAERFLNKHHKRFFSLINTKRKTIKLNKALILRIALFLHSLRFIWFKCNPCLLKFCMFIVDLFTI